MRIEIDDFLELEPYEIPKAKLITASGMIEPEVKILEKIMVGEITIEKLPVVIHEIPDPAPIKILLGMNFIKNINLWVNGKDNAFNIEDP
jgi:predicted aspartyl protease